MHCGWHHHHACIAGGGQEARWREQPAFWRGHLHHAICGRPHPDECRCLGPHEWPGNCHPSSRRHLYIGEALCQAGCSSACLWNCSLLLRPWPAAHCLPGSSRCSDPAPVCTPLQYTFTACPRSGGACVDVTSTDPDARLYSLTPGTEASHAMQVYSIQVGHLVCLAMQPCLCASVCPEAGALAVQRPVRVKSQICAGQLSAV